jgi:hypothetical protein
MLIWRGLHLILVFGLAAATVSCSRQTAPVPAASGQESATAAHPQPEAAAGEDDKGSAAAPHTDHESNHGGTFFMALDNRHHLEGVLDFPGVFRVYLYDDHTQPLDRASIGQAQARVIWGEEDGAPEIELKPSADGSVLEARAPGAMRFPVVLTLLVRFPGAAANAKPELFTFPFSEYTHRDSQSHGPPDGG